MSAERLAVHCDDSFHEGESVPLRAFVRVDGEWLIASPEDDLLTGDSPHFATGGSLADLSTAATRERRRIDCDCGASLIMRAERMESILDKLADGSVASISLARLNLLVSTVR